MFFDHNTTEYFTKIINMSSSPGHLNYSGIALSLFAIDDFTFGELGYIHNNEIKKIKLESETDISNLLFVCVEKFIRKNNYGLFLVDGFIQHNDWNLEEYKKIYVDSSSEGRFSQDDEQDLKFEIGLATSSSIFYFNSFTPAGGSTVIDTPTVVNNYITNSVALTPNTASYNKPTVLTNSPVYIIGDISIAYTNYYIYKIENNTEIVVFDSGDLPGYLTSYTLPELLVLDENVEFYWKIRYKDNTGKYHSWSTVSAFTILPSFLANLIVMKPQNTVIPPLTMELDFDIVGNVTCLSYRYQICNIDNSVLYDSNEQVYSSRNIIMYTGINYVHNTSYKVRFCLKDSKNKWTEWSGYFIYTVNLGWNTFTGVNRSTPFTLITYTGQSTAVNICRLSDTKIAAHTYRNIGYYNVTGTTISSALGPSPFFDVNVACPTMIKLNEGSTLCAYLDLTNAQIKVQIITGSGLFINGGIVILGSYAINDSNNYHELSLIPINDDNTLFCIITTTNTGIRYYFITIVYNNSNGTFSITHNTATHQTNMTNLLSTPDTLSEIHGLRACMINKAESKIMVAYRNRSGTDPRLSIQIYSFNLTTFNVTKINTGTQKLSGGDCWYIDLCYLSDNYAVVQYSNNADPGYATRAHLVRLNGTIIEKSDPLILNANGYNPSTMIAANDEIVLIFHNTNREIHVLTCNKTNLTMTKNASTIQFDTACSSLGTDWSKNYRRYMSCCKVDPNTIALLVSANSYNNSVCQLFKV